MFSSSWSDLFFVGAVKFILLFVLQTFGDFPRHRGGWGGRGPWRGGGGRSRGGYYGRGYGYTGRGRGRGMSSRP